MCFLYDGGRLRECGKLEESMADAEHTPAPPVPVRIAPEVTRSPAPKAGASSGTVPVIASLPPAQHPPLWVLHQSWRSSTLQSNLRQRLGPRFSQVR